MYTYCKFFQFFDYFQDIIINYLHFLLIIYKEIANYMLVYFLKVINNLIHFLLYLFAFNLLEQMNYFLF